MGKTNPAQHPSFRFLNERRLRDYPRLFFVAVWAVFIVNLLFHQGWAGRFGGIIGVDFLAFYSSGVLYQQDINNLYNFHTQAQLQQSLFQPTKLYNTVNILIIPPYHAFFNSIFSLTTLFWAFILWTLLSIISAGIAIYLLHRFLLPTFLKFYLPISQLAIVVASSVPFFTGLFFGQNNIFTFLLLVGITLAMKEEKWCLAGFLGGLLLYKPNFLLGFLLLWIVWGRYRALVCFGIVALLWTGAVIVQYGLGPYLDYMKVPSIVLQFPYTPGIILETTPYALLLTIIPRQVGSILGGTFLSIWLVLNSSLLAVYAFKIRKRSDQIKNTAILLATLFPIWISPHTLIYDLITLVLTFVLWAALQPSRNLVYLIIFTYLGVLILPALTASTGIALLAIIPVVLVFFVLKDIKYGLQNKAWI